MNIQVKNVVICTPCPDSQHVIAIRGVFDISLLSSQSASLEYIRHLVNSGKRTLDNCYESNVIG